MDYKALYEDLANGPALVRALTHGISQEEAMLKPDPESWSVLEVLGHLYDEEREDFRRRLDLMLLHPGEPWPPIHPGAWVTERAYNSRQLDEMLASWLEERRISLLWLDAMHDPDWETEAASPWGTMKAGELLASWAAHDKLHFRQLLELRYQRVARLADPYTLQYAGEW